MSNARVSSDVRMFSQRVAGLKEARDLTRLTYKGWALDVALADAIGAHTWARAMREEDPDGQRWAELSPRYKAWKEKHGYPTQIGRLTGEMLQSPNFLARKHTVTGFWLTARYSGSEFARKKLRWFSKGNSKQNRPARPVLGVDDKLRAKIRAMVAEAYREWTFPRLGGRRRRGAR